MRGTDQADTEFVDAAADDVRRKAKIQELTQKRKKLSLGAGIVTPCGLAIAFIDGFGKSSNASGSALSLFVAAVMLIQLFRCESDLRLLKLVEKLKK